MATKEIDVIAAGKNITLLGGILDVLLKVQKKLEGTNIPDGVHRDLSEAITLASKTHVYCDEKSSEFSAAMQKIKNGTFEGDFGGCISVSDVIDMDPHMMTAYGQVRLLKMLVRAMGAKNVLEVGGFTGFGALGMSEGMAPEGKVTTIEIDPALCKYISHIAKETKRNIEAVNGPALDVLRQMAKENKQFDLIYVDCVKDEYHTYQQIIMEGNLLTENGIIAFDNCLQEGSCVLRNTEIGRSVDNFNTMLNLDKRVEQVLLPMFDGLMLVQHKR